MAHRVCDKCHIRMPPFKPRFTEDDGNRVCEGCHNGRPGRPLTGKLEEPIIVKHPVIASAPFIRIGGSLIKTAHQSGDGVTIYHCFATEVAYWTYDGLKTLGETVGTVQRVLTNVRGGAVWRDAMIHSFGEQRLWNITLRRNQQTKVLRATADHRWLVRVRNDLSRTESRIVRTEDLQEGDRLSWSLPKSFLATSTPSTFGIAHGIVYGDGTKTGGGSVVRLWGEKDAQLIRYFNESLMYPEKTPNGVLGQRVVNLPSYFKDRPSLDEQPSYLYGWLAGYFAADGSVGKTGDARLDSSSREHLEFAQLIATRLGIATYDIRMQMRKGYGEEETPLYTLPFISSTIPSNFFLIAEHRERHEDKVARGNPEHLGWIIVSVEDSGVDEEVFCPRVPSENFVLDGWINTMNCPFCGSGQVVAGGDGTCSCDFCSTTFIVQVQPEKASMPQTINGSPFQIPGMPPVGQDPGAQPGAPSPADEASGGGDDDSGGSFGGDNLSEKADDPKDGGDDGGAPPSGGSDEKSGGDSKPSWLDKKSSALFLTEDGVALPYDKYIAHLALKNTADREATLQEVIQSTEAS